MNLFWRGLRSAFKNEKISSSAQILGSNVVETCALCNRYNMDDHKCRHIDNNFVPYIPQLHDWKYSNSQYYKQILHEYYIKNPHNDYKQAYEYLSSNIRHQQQNIIKQMNMPWKLLSFDNVWRDIKTKYNGVKRKSFTKKNTQKGVDLLNIIMIDIKQSEIFTLLNKISHETNHELPNILHIPWGDCIRSMISIIEVIKKLNKYFRNKTETR